MGIFIHMAISGSVTKDEWTPVYEETLQLVEAFPFAERLKIPVRGIQTICLVPSKEREHSYGWPKNKVRTGWIADGDYEYLCSAESYFLPRDLVIDDKYDPDAPDAMFSILPAYLDYKWNDPRFQQCYALWGAKTQGEPYHMYLLAVACLIESRLGPKACVYGDITKGQCRKAVEMANQYLSKEIDLPALCNPEKMLARIKTFPFPESEMLKIYTHLYLGNQDAAFGNAIRKEFSGAAFDIYWKERLGRFQITTYDFSNALYDYLLWGFPLDRLPEFVTFHDKEGNTHYDDFVRRIMEAKLYQQNKDCSDILKIDRNDEHPYGISMLLAQFAFGGAENKKVNRYIPLEDIRKSLISSIGTKCDVDQLIDNYLKEEEDYQNKYKKKLENMSKEDLELAVSHDASAVFTQFMEEKRRAIEKRHKEYDISEFSHLPFYESGDSINPAISEQARTYFTFYKNIVNEERYSKLMNESGRKRCEWLVFQNRSILLRDIDWDRIFGNIIDNPESFARYYPMVRVEIIENDLIHLIRAIAVNDDFYHYLLVPED